MTLRVIGAGLGRTGTASLKHALERLLGGRCHHMFEVIQNPDEIPVWTRAAEGLMPEWTSFLRDYTALVDWPGCSFWPELADAFPEALVLLSVRDLDAWYDSAEATIFHRTIENPGPVSESDDPPRLHVAHDPAQPVRDRSGRSPGGHRRRRRPQPVGCRHHP